MTTLSEYAAGGYGFLPQAKLRITRQGTGEQSADITNAAIVNAPRLWCVDWSTWSGYDVRPNDLSGRFGIPDDAKLDYQVWMWQTADGHKSDEASLISVYTAVSTPAQVYCFAFPAEKGHQHPLVGFLLQRFEFDVLRGLVALGEAVAPQADAYTVGAWSVNVRERPRLAGKRLATLYYGRAVSVVGAAVERDGYHWLPIETAASVRGWIASEAARLRKL